MLDLFDLDLSLDSEYYDTSSSEQEQSNEIKNKTSK